MCHVSAQSVAERMINTKCTLLLLLNLKKQKERQRTKVAYSKIVIQDKNDVMDCDATQEAMALDTVSFSSSFSPF